MSCCLVLSSRLASVVSVTGPEQPSLNQQAPGGSEPAAVPRVLVDLSVAAAGGAGTYSIGFARGLIESADRHKDQVVVLSENVT